MLNTLTARLRRAPITREVDRAKVEALLGERDRIRGRAAELATQVAEVEEELIGLLRGAEEAVADGKVLFTCRPDGTFASRQFMDAHPTVAAEFMREVPALDVAALAEARPDLYRQYRAVQLRIRA